MLITPLSFYTFHNSLLNELKKRGYQVDLINDEFPSNIFGQIFSRISLSLLRYLTLRHLIEKLKRESPYDLIMIIKGRGLSAKSLEFLRTKAKIIVGYNFDSFLFNPSPLDWKHLTDRYTTFDINDSKTYELPLVHLFSDVNVVPCESREYDLSIIQRIHSDRLSSVHNLLKSVPNTFNTFIFLYEKNVITCIINFLRDPFHYICLWPYISFKPMSYSKAMDKLRCSWITFDNAHPLQTGITIRCFEAQSLGVFILTNNQEVVKSGIFSESTIACIPRRFNSAKVTQILIELLRKSPSRYVRDAQDFIDDLINLEEIELTSLSSSNGK